MWEVLVYNSLSGKILYTSNNNIIEKIKKENYTEPELENKLFSYGFLVNTNETETEGALLAYFDKIANKDLTLTILPTLQCNFRCNYCYEDFKNDRITASTIDGIVAFVKKNIQRFDRLFVDWFGGEPLLEINAINELSQKLIQVCRDYKKPYIASMTTNGYLLTENVFKSMLHNKILSYQITLDGEEQNHNRNRHLVNGGETYSTILKNLQDIKEHIKAYFSIIIRTNLTLDMSERIEAYIEFLHNNFGDDRRFSFLFRPVGNWGGERVSQMQSEMITDFSSVLDKMARSKIQLNYGVYYNSLRNGICEAAKRNSYVIKPSGEVCKCTALLDSADNQIGRLDSNGDMILNKDLLSKWIYRFDKMPDKCISCSMLPTCGNSSCPANCLFSQQKYSCGYENFYIKQTLNLLSKNAKKYNFIEVLDE